MSSAAAVEVFPYDLAAIIDPVGDGIDGVGEIDGGEAAVHIQEEAMSHKVAEKPHDLAAIVDPVGDGTTEGPRDIDRVQIGEQQKPGGLSCKLLQNQE
jgi:hypothetical protein